MEVRKPPHANDAVANDPRVRLHRTIAQPGPDVDLGFYAEYPQERRRGYRLYQTARTRNASRRALDRSGSRGGSRRGRGAARPWINRGVGDPPAPAREPDETNRQMGDQNEGDGERGQRGVGGPQTEESDDRGWAPSPGAGSRSRGVTNPRHR